MALLRIRLFYHSYFQDYEVKVVLLSHQVLVLVGGDAVDDDFMKRVPSRSLWYAQQFHRGPGLMRNIEWKLLTKIPEPPRFRHAVCLFNNKLYILGGRKY